MLIDDCSMKYITVNYLPRQFFLYKLLLDLGYHSMENVFSFFFSIFRLK